MLIRKVISIITVCLFMASCSMPNIEPIDVDKTLEDKNIISHNRYNTLAINDEEDVYIAFKNSIYKTNSENYEFVCINSSNDKIIHKIMFVDDQICYYDVENMYLMNKDGTNITIILKMSESGGKVFWTEAYSVGNDIYLYNFLSGNTAKLIKKNDEYSTESVQFKIENIFVNDNGDEFEFFVNDDRGMGTLLHKNVNTYVESKEIYGSKYVMLTNNYVFYCVGSSNDLNTNLTLYRKNINDNDNMEVIKFDRNISFVSYDEKYIYFHDYQNYYRIKQDNLNIEKSILEYNSDVLIDICVGDIYNIQTNTPVIYNFEGDTGEFLKLK